MSNRDAYNWEMTGPDGCDAHCIKHPCGKCAEDAGVLPRSNLRAARATEEHECDEKLQPDFDFCSACGEHTGFCSVCRESSCCGALPLKEDYDFSGEDR